MFTSMTNSKIKVASILFAGIVVASGASNIGLVRSASNLWTQDGQTVKLVDEGNRTLQIGGSLNLTGASGSGNLSITSDFYSIGGIDYASVQQSFTGATTTPCSIQNPWGTATSSLMAYAMQITTGTSTASAFDLATSTTAFATTTNLVAGHSVASGAQTTLSWFPSGAQNAIVAPTEWVNLKTVGAGLSGYTYTGTCNAVFIKP